MQEDNGKHKDKKIMGIDVSDNCIMVEIFTHVDNNNNVHSSIRNMGCLQFFSNLLGSW
jgi:hypothetical protein